MILLAVRLIDLAIFGTLGALWIVGFVFIVVLYRWILRFEREQDSASSDAGDGRVATEQPEVRGPS